MEAYHFWRYHPFAQQLGAALDSGVVGAIERVDARFEIPMA